MEFEMRLNSLRCLFLFCMTLAAAVGAFHPAGAQGFPTGVIRIVVPTSASTPPDILARIIAAAMSEGEGWKVIVENKPGAVNTIGAMEVVKSPADGHTILSITAPFAAVPALVPNAAFKYDKDFAPLIRIGTGYNVLVVNPSVPVHSVAELIAYLKKDPGKYTFSSGGFGTPPTCSANCSSSRPVCRRRMYPTCSSRRRSAIWLAA